MPLGKKLVVVEEVMFPQEKATVYHKEPFEGFARYH